MENESQQTRKKRIGVLLSNLGTPDAPTAEALRVYLKEFLWDRRVVDVPRPIWWVILNVFILTTRPAKSAAAYREIWTDDGSPLLSISNAQLAAVTEALAADESNDYVVALGMRYGNPSLESALNQLRQHNLDELIVLPLYPQNSCSTTASTFDVVTELLREGRNVPSLRFISHYHNHPMYIEALANSVREAWQAKRGEKLLISFHGTPVRYRTEGDPYYQQCVETAELLAQELELDESQWRISFQSRFGREEWLQPYTDETLKQLASVGVKSVDVICPGFSADCLETLEEIAEENKGYFIEAGGESLNYIPALNSRDDHIQALAEIIRHC